MAAAGSAYGASVPVSLASGGTNDGAVDSFLQYITSAEEQPSFAAIEGSGLSAPDRSAYSLELVGGGIEFDGGSLFDVISLDRGNEHALPSSGAFSVAAPVGSIGDGGGMVSPTVVPLPAPVAMGGIGLISLGGFAAWKRRARA